MNCADVYKIFFHPGEVTEIRAFGLSGKSKVWDGYAGGSGIVYGYFDNADDFGFAAESLDDTDKRGVNIYFMLNPLYKDILAKAPNCLIAASKEGDTTGDKHVTSLRWLPIDIDAKYAHKLKIGATDTEVKETLKVRNEIYKFLKTWGFADPIPACSGNGAHLVYRLTDDQIKVEARFDLVERVVKVKTLLKLLNEKFENTHCEVDTGVFNPSRIWRLYGTTARKGFNQIDRPYRRSYIEHKYIESIK